MAFDDETIQKVWEKGKTVSGSDATQSRKDECGAWISRGQYGNRKSQYGWEIDHIVSRDNGGSDALSNLRPLQWENNATKGSGRLVCAVTASGNENKKIGR